MKTFQLRVVKEKEDLDLKIQNLEVFLDVNLNISSKTHLDPLEVNRLQIQLNIMKQYSAILSDRIANFEVADNG